jgi:hypothetical protein
MKFYLLNFDADLMYTFIEMSYLMWEFNVRMN